MRASGTAERVCEHTALVPVSGGRVSHQRDHDIDVTSFGSA